MPCCELHPTHGHDRVLVTAASLLLVLLFGFGIGATGIGGVGIVPTLVALGGLSVTGAVAIAHASLVVTGCIGIAMHRRLLVGLERDLWRVALWAALGTVLGAVLLPYVAGSWLEIAVGGLMIVSGGIEIRRRFGGSLAPSTTPAGGTANWRLIGGAVGFGSALTGTGGPILLIPVMLLLGAEPRRTVALAQMIQIPVAGSATLVHLSRGAVDLQLAAIVGGLMAIGVVAGSLLTQRIATDSLRLLLATTLIAGGVVFLALRA